MGAKILIDAKMVAPDRPLREPRHDQRKVSGLRDHRIGTIGRALPGTAVIAWKMGIGHDLEASGSAMRPKRLE